jgi:hypothetical protein
MMGLQEVVINADEEEESRTYVPSATGFQKLNHQFTAFLPGNNNNTLFNALRLQPGILAAGEQAQDFMIWGSYKGETQIIWDGITLFNASSFNEHIGIVNPLMVKDIEVHKAGYDGRWGDRVGGVVNITSRSGYRSGLQAQFNLNNQTASGRINIPIAKRSSLQAAFRKSYFNRLGAKFNESKETYSPYYNFGDLNCKYAGHTRKGNTYSLSLLASNDEFTEKVNKDLQPLTFYRNTSIEKNQWGASFFYGKKGKNGGITNTTLAYSSLGAAYENYFSINDKAAAEDSSDYNSTINGIGELSVKTEHLFPANQFHAVKIGAGWVQNTTLFYQDSIKQLLKFSAEQMTRFNAYVTDHITLSPALSVEPGFRVDLPLEDLTCYLQPRIALHLKAGSNLRFNLRYGIYNQFVAENALVDQFSNYLYYWSIADPKSSTVLKSSHYVAGMSWNPRPGHLKVEGFYKTTEGLTRYYWDEGDNGLSGSKGKAQAYGLDFHFQKKWGSHDLWLAYTWSNILEHFDHFTSDDFQRAPHDQRHEVKATGILNFHPFFASISYIYGSGIPNVAQQNSNLDITTYNRLDLALLYQFKGKKVRSEAGLSILNLLNNQNTRYNNFYSFPDGDLPYSHSTPFTPLLFLNIGI